MSLYDFLLAHWLFLLRCNPLQSAIRKESSPPFLTQTAPSSQTTQTTNHKPQTPNDRESRHADTTFKIKTSKATNQGQPKHSLAGCHNVSLSFQLHNQPAQQAGKHS
jgi:hypothetical protein